MKKCIGLLALISLSLFVACNAVESPFGGTRANAYLGIPSEAFLSENEQAAIAEMNYARTRPKEYVQNVLQPFLDNNCYNDYNRTTYLQTAIDTMNAMTPVEPLKAALGLTLAARDFITDPNRNVHSSTSEGFWVSGDRAKRYGVLFSVEIAWPNGGVSNSGKCSETATAGWIIDRGNAHNGYGHRRGILGASFSYIGFAFGYGAANSVHAGYRNAPATYATLAEAGYKDLETGDYKGGAPKGTPTDPLTKTSISEVVTWPVLRYINGQFVEFDAKGRKGKTVKNPGGKTTYLPESY